MLGKTNRVSSEMFAQLKRPQKTFTSTSFSVSSYSSKDIKSPLISVVVSKKVAKSAVTRNKIRRRVYSIVKKYISRLKTQILVFHAKKDIVDKKFDSLDNEIIEILKKV